MFIIILLFIASYNSGTITATISFSVKCEFVGISGICCLSKMRLYCCGLLLRPDLDTLRHNNYFLFTFIPEIWLPMGVITGG